MPTPAYSMLVLVVDDSLVNRTLLEHWLGTVRARVLQAANLQQARALLALHQPTHLIVDQHLPDGNGLTLYAEYHSSQPGRWIASTTPDGPEHLVRLKSAGFADVLVKPIAQAQLLSLIRPQPQSEMHSTVLPDIDADQPFVPVLDHADALRRLGGDAELLAMLAQGYLSDWADLPQRLWQHWHGGAREQLKRDAHTAAGLSGQFGLPALRRRLLLLEYTVRDPQADPRLIEALLAGVESAHHLGIPALRAAIAQQGNA